VAVGPRSSCRIVQQHRCPAISSGQVQESFLKGLNYAKLGQKKPSLFLLARWATSLISTLAGSLVTRHVYGIDAIHESWQVDANAPSDDRGVDGPLSQLNTQSDQYRRWHQLDVINELTDRCFQVNLEFDQGRG
jgi:hypothetical protein